jgi:membrane associated rhomboid family serine protease
MADDDKAPSSRQEPRPDPGPDPRPDPKPDPKPDAKPDDDAWIERVVGIAGDLGFNKMRLRWKLIRWQERRRRKAREREQVIAHVTYAHKTCHECGAVQDKHEAICTRCGVKLGSRRFQMLERLGLATPVPISMSTLLAVAILVAYGRAWVVGGGGLSAPGGTVLVELGGRWPPAMADEPWRLVTAMFLHAGLWHLGFNILAIASVGPRIEELYGRATMLALFIATGALANLATLEVGRLAVGVGASGGVMGLVGVAAGAGHRAGTSHGRALRDDMLKWGAYTLVFGFAVGADNWAHMFGIIAGAAFGYLVSPEVWTRRSLFLVRTGVGLAGLIATLGAVAIILTRTPSPREDTRERPGDVVDQRAMLDGPRRGPPQPAAARSRSRL